MKKFVAIIFLSLYIYNIAGYLALFAVMQQRARAEIKKSLKQSVPEHELHHFAFHTPSLDTGVYPIQWIDDHEFRYNGSMYDIVRQLRVQDTTYFVCVNDIQEERLFAHLDSHVQRHMGDSGQPGKLDPFKDVFKDSLTRTIFVASNGNLCGTVAPPTPHNYLFTEPDVPSLPPRQS